MFAQRYASVWHVPQLTHLQGPLFAKHSCAKHSVRRFARESAVHAQHKDVQDIIFTEEIIRERIAVMGRCVANVTLFRSYGVAVIAG